MAKQQEVSIIVRAVDKASKVLKESTRNIGQRAERNKATFQKMASGGGAALAGLGFAVKNFTEEAAATREVEEAFGRLADSVGNNSDDILKALQKSSKGAIDNKNLMLAANKVISLGVAKDTDEFSTLMDIARVKAKNMGLSTTQAFDDIVTGLGRGSAMILDNLGITINATEAQELYAAQIGKTAEELTDAEKKQALINKVVSDGKKELEAAGDVAVTAAERKQILNAKITNLQTTIGTAFIPILEKLVDAVTPIIDKVTVWIEENPKLTQNIVIATGAVLGLVTVLGSLGLVIPTIITGVKLVGGALTFLAANPIGLAIVAVGALIAAGVALYKNRDEVKAFAKKTWNNIKDEVVVAGRIMLGVLTGGFSELAIYLYNNRENIRLGTVEKLSQIRDFFSESWNSIKDTADSIGNSIRSIFDNVFSSIKDAATDAMNRVTNKVNSVIQKVKDAANRVKSLVGLGNSSGSSGGRAVGGMVLAGQTYRVGEMGPETFTPLVNGRIESNGSGSGANININMGGVTIANGRDEQYFKELMNDTLRKAVRNLNLGIA